MKAVVLKERGSLRNIEKEGGKKIRGLKAVRAAIGARVKITIKKVVRGRERTVGGERGEVIVEIRARIKIQESKLF